LWFAIGSLLEAISQFAHVAQSVEHVLGKNGVIGSNPIVGSISVRYDRRRLGLWLRVRAANCRPKATFKQEVTTNGEAGI
jgi:hypothetical protein